MYTPEDVLSREAYDAMSLEDKFQHVRHKLEAGWNMTDVFWFLDEIEQLMKESKKFKGMRIPKEARVVHLSPGSDPNYVYAVQGEGETSTNEEGNPFIRKRMVSFVAMHKLTPDLQNLIRQAVGEDDRKELESFQHCVEVSKTEQEEIEHASRK